MSAALLVALAVEVLTLDRAVEAARRNQPQLRQARATAAASEARAIQLRAPLLPQLNTGANYQRATANFAFRPGQLPSQLQSGQGGFSFDTFDFFSFNLSASQTLFDWGAFQRYRAGEATAAAQRESLRGTERQIVLGVRSAFFSARARRALVEVARQGLASQERHRDQIQGFVEVGRKPAIDLAQARADVAQARLTVINAENAYAQAKVDLYRAIGRDDGADHEVAEEALPPVRGEDEESRTLIDEAVAARPELAFIDRQRRAQGLTLSAQKGGFAPTLGANSGFTGAGTDLSRLAWNWSASLSLSWNLFAGLATIGQIREAEATLAGLDAQHDGLRQQIVAEVAQAVIAVRGAKAALVAAGEARALADERLQLAEGRYSAGVGNVIELADAQGAATAAAAQRVQADYNLALARAQLAAALGRDERP